MADDDHEPQGRFLGVPYDWRRPTVRRIRSRVWNHDEQRVLVPRPFGWGWSVNLLALGRRLRRR